jgi:hypothetical protein
MAGFQTGPHVLAPHVGGNLLEIPASAQTATVTVTRDPTAAPGASPNATAILFPGFLNGSEFVIPFLLPNSGLWDVAVGTTTFVANASGPPDYGTDTAGDFAVGVVTPFVPDPEPLNFTVLAAARGNSGGWVPFSGAMALGFGSGAGVPATAMSPGLYRATLNASSSLGPAGNASFPLLTLSVALQAASSGSSATIPISLLGSPEVAVRGPKPPSGPEAIATLTREGYYLAWAIGTPGASPSPGASMRPIEAKVLHVGSSSLDASPLFPDHVPLSFDARFSLSADGRPVTSPGRVFVGWENVNGTNATLVAANSDGFGNVGAAIALPRAGSYHIRLAVPSFSFNATFGVTAGARAGSEGGDQGTGGANANLSSHANGPRGFGMPAPDAVLVASALVGAAAAAAPRRARQARRRRP